MTIVAAEARSPMDEAIHAVVHYRGVLGRAQQRVETAPAAIASLDSTVASWRREVDSLTAQLDRARVQIDQLTAERDRLAGLVATDITARDAALADFEIASAALERSRYLIAAAPDSFPMNPNNAEVSA